MIFRPELALAICERRKTETRRVPSDNPRSPWHPDRVERMVGQVRGVQPGRGRPTVCHIRITDVALLRLGVLSTTEARAEGFDNPTAFESAWMEIHGTYEPQIRVWVVRFVLTAMTPERYRELHEEVRT